MQEVRIGVKQAVNAARKAGKLSAELERFAEDLLEPKVPWPEILARFLDSHATRDYNWGRPNRRYIQQGILLPSLYSPAYGRIVMGCDTSGSINQDQLKEICAEVINILEGYEEQGNAPEVTVAWFDTKVYPQVVSDPEDLSPKGGGGTSFRVVFEWLATQDDSETKGIVMVTDGHCHDYGTPPDIPVLWILTQTNPRFAPPFGEVAFILN
jgi:predicted metal-dependent peptidase